MHEIEVKFRVKDFRKIRSILKSHGARMIWNGIEENIFFDTKGQNLYKKKILFRLRRWGGHSAALTVKTIPKQKSKKFKIRREYQTEIEDFAAARNMFQALGFVEDFLYKKSREHWKWNAVFVELDTIGRIRFIEIEGSKKDIHEAADMLGLHWKNAERRGYVTILKGMKKK